MHKKFIFYYIRGHKRVQKWYNTSVEWIPAILTIHHKCLPPLIHMAHLWLTFLEHFILENNFQYKILIYFHYFIAMKVYLCKEGHAALIYLHIFIYTEMRWKTGPRFRDPAWYHGRLLHPSPRDHGFDAARGRHQTHEPEGWGVIIT